MSNIEQGIMNVEGTEQILFSLEKPGTQGQVRVLWLCLKKYCKSLK